MKFSSFNEEECFNPFFDVQGVKFNQSVLVMTHRHLLIAKISDVQGVQKFSPDFKILQLNEGFEFFNAVF